MVTVCPETPAVHPAPTRRKLIYKSHLGHSAVSQITYPTLQSKGAVLLCPVFSAKELVFFVNSFFRFKEKKKKKPDQFTLRKNERHTVANSLTNKIMTTVLVPYLETGRGPDARNK